VLAKKSKRFFIHKFETLEKSKIVKFSKDTGENNRDEAMNSNTAASQRISKGTLMKCISEVLLRDVNKFFIFVGIEVVDEIY
jgi:hypothetical protein